MVLSTRASKVVRMGLYGLMVRFSTFLDAPRRKLVPGLPDRIAAVKRKDGDSFGPGPSTNIRAKSAISGAHGEAGQAKTRT